MYQRLLAVAAVLSPAAAFGSFGGGGCRDDFVCHFMTWGLLLGIAAVPISGVIFAVLHLVACNGERSKLNQFFVGGLVGIVAYEISAACAALMATLGQSSIGHNENYPLIGLSVAYVVLAIASVIYARSSPRTA